MFCSLLIILLVITSHDVTASQSVLVKSLPGFPGDLPFKLETGYVSVGDFDEVQLFYYFIESERNPKDDPLLLWLTGGPGCSAFSGLVYEIGPLSFDPGKSTGNLPNLKLNPYSWTKVASIIFLDAPVGTGFSYASTAEGYNITDTLSAKETFTFLCKWLMSRPKFLQNPLYIGGDSYSGIQVPIIVQIISDYNDDERGPPMNLKGYLLGNPVTDIHKDKNTRIPFAHLKSLLSDELYEATKIHCKEEYLHVDPNNALCINDLQVVNECLQNINLAQILEPSCSVEIWKSRQNPTAVAMDSDDLLPWPHRYPEPWCRSYIYLSSYIWANDKTVQNALHVREGTIKEWVRCNKSLSYVYDVPSSLIYHRNLVKKGYRVLIYSGDHDMVIPYLGTHAWIEALNLTLVDDWQPWFVNGQVAGYSTGYKYKKCQLTFATVKGGGHTAPEYKPEECLAMIYRWLAFYPL
ncbi:serine carboxypeptidase-like 1 [Ziziphus jujuba]|uniref:Serine carboxypeptidase-like 1 n=1 Tax=Ziziphus jujuba TaxID=326968 RepID=A0ABM3IX50_ZIZJJ|nr:serine carboxypeptidase-like 1 [Ziziphus jujuba]